MAPMKLQSSLITLFVIQQVT